MKWLALGLLAAVNVFIFSIPVPSGLTVLFFNIGQGDSIFIQSSDGVQLLVDGGPGSSVLRELGQVMPFWDRTVDAVVATHPDADHIGGLVDVLKRYDVGTIFESGTENDTRMWSAFVAARDAEMAAGARDVLARRGMRILLGGGGAYADVLYPDHDVSGVKETNAASIVLHVVYGDTSFMLTGDAPSNIEERLSAFYGSALKSDVLKAGHHGSKTSNSAKFIDFVSPHHVVFSRGCENRYGHPAPEIVTLFSSLAIPTFDTCEQGTVTFRSDGQTLAVGQ